MKKFIFSVLTVLFCWGAFVGCSKEEKMERKFERNIVGTWQESRYYDSEEGWHDNQEEKASFWEFGSNSRGIYTGYNREEEYKLSFRYSISSDRLYFDFDNGDIGACTIESLTSKTMVWKKSYGDFESKLELKSVSKKN